jgi:hypothetical protein
MRTVIFRFKRFLIAIVGVEVRRTNLAKKLGSFFTVIVIQVCMGGFAEWALFSLRNGFSATKLDRFERMVMLGLISLQQRPVI